MNRGSVIFLKKFVFGLVITICCLEVMVPTTFLLAAVSEKSVKNNTVSIKDTALTFNQLKEAPKGSVGVYLDVTLDKADGIPRDTNYIDIKGSGKVNINGKEYTLALDSSRSFEIISDTQAHALIYAKVITESQGYMVPCKDVEVKLFKGKNMEFRIWELTYEQLINEVNPDFLQALKNASNVQPISLENSDLKIFQGQIKGMTNTLPSKGLNIPITPGGTSRVDNIGFHDGILEIRVIEAKGKNKAVTGMKLVDSQGKSATSAGGCNVDNIRIYRYAIKDATELAKYEVKATTYKQLAIDKETKLVTCVF